MNPPSPPPSTVDLNNRPKSLVVVTGAAIAFAIMGDSLMYSLLPLEAANLGIPFEAVGVLLAANRIVRLLSNTWASLAFERWGPRRPFILAAVLGFITTVLYGVGWGFGVFLLARAGWGIAWSAFRQGGYQAVWAESEAIKGRLMGLLWGIVRLGSAVSVILGGYLYDIYGYKSAVGAVAFGTLLAIPVALKIRWPGIKSALPAPPRSPFEGWRTAFETKPRRRVLFVGFMYTFFEGVLGATASLFLAAKLGAGYSLANFGIGTLAGIMLAVRYIANMFFGPLLGALSDRLGQAPTISILSAGILAGISGAVLLPGFWPLLCLALVFFAGSGMFAACNAAASGLAQQTKRPQLFVGFFSTSIDAGAALGPLLVYSTGNENLFSAIYISAAILLLISSFRYMHAEKWAGFAAGL
ncbi:MAG: MFS transporter [Anaerolineae bacterium]|nr:MFS transporter [Anaerolineae bacterium]